MAAILYFSILRLIPYFDSVDPVLIAFSMLWTPYMQVFMLSSGSAHVGLQMLHIDSAKQSVVTHHMSSQGVIINIIVTPREDCHGEWKQGFKSPGGSEKRTSELS